MMGGTGACAAARHMHGDAFIIILDTFKGLGAMN